MEVDASKKSEQKDKAQECPAQASSAPTNPAAVPSGKKGVGGLRAKIRHYFPTRRSCRIVPKYLDDLRYQLLREQVALAVHESFLEIISSPTKGRGLRTNKEFFKDQFVVEYRGEVLSMKKAKRREKLYARNPTIGCFMFYFKLNESTWCIDATRESEEKGRLVNHSRLSPNLKAKVLDLGNKHPQLCLMALRDIEQGEELTFDYGDRTPLTVGKHPWLLNT